MSILSRLSQKKSFLNLYEEVITFVDKNTSVLKDLHKEVIVEIINEGENSETCFLPDDESAWLEVADVVSDKFPGLTEDIAYQIALKAHAAAMDLKITTFEDPNNPGTIDKDGDALDRVNNAAYQKFIKWLGRSFSTKLLGKYYEWIKIVA